VSDSAGGDNTLPVQGEGVSMPQTSIPTVPTNEATVTSRSPLLQWVDPLGNASHFRVFVSGPQGRIVDTWVNTAQHQLATSLAAGDYQWWVFAHNEYGDGGGRKDQVSPLKPNELRLPPL